MKTFINTLLLSLCFVGILLASCKRSDPPPAPPPAKPLVVTVGGWAGNQLGPFNLMAQTEFDKAETVSFGEWNAYLSGVYGYLESNPRDKLVAVGHSWGADRVCRDVGKYEFMHPGKVKLVILIEPVCMAMGKTVVYPPTGVRCIVFRAQWHLGTVPAAVYGPHEEIFVPNSNHNDIVVRVIGQCGEELRGVL